MGTIRMDESTRVLEVILSGLEIEVTAKPLPANTVAKVARMMGATSVDAERAYQRLQNVHRLEARGWTVEGRRK